MSALSEARAALEEAQNQSALWKTKYDEAIYRLGTECAAAEDGLEEAQAKITAAQELAKRIRQGSVDRRWGAGLLLAILEGGEMSDKAHFFKRGAAKSVCGMKDAADTERTANSRDGRCSLCMAIVERKGLRA